MQNRKSQSFFPLCMFGSVDYCCNTLLPFLSTLTDSSVPNHCSLVSFYFQFSYFFSCHLYTRCLLFCIYLLVFLSCFSVALVATTSDLMIAIRMHSPKVKREWLLYTYEIIRERVYCGYFLWVSDCFYLFFRNLHLVVVCFAYFLI